MSDTMLEVRGLGVRVAERRGARGAGHTLLHDVAFDVAAGSSVGVVGASGAGKSTLALALLRLLPAPLWLDDRTRIMFAGRDLASLDAEALRAVRGRGISLISQEPLAALNPSMPAAAQLAEALEVHGLASIAEAAARAATMLDRVGIGRAAARRFPHELSGGMRQRLMIAMALIVAPQLVVADEPTTALDPVRQREMLDLLDTLRRESGTALLLISHDLDVVGERCARTLVLDAGRVVEDGRTADVLARQRPTARAPLRPREASATEPLLEVRGLSVTYPARGRGPDALVEVTAVKDISFTLRRGESVGIIGESGCGKTSLAHAILRLGPSRATAMRFDGDELARLEGEALRRIRKSLQFVPTGRRRIAYGAPHLRSAGERGDARAWPLRCDRRAPAGPRSPGAARPPRLGGIGQARGALVRVSDSAWPWRARSGPIRGCSSSTSQSLRSIRSPASACSSASPTSAPSAASRCSSSPTTSHRSPASRIASS
jgi:peptide/nickel transport system ATP-binding protein